MFQFLLSKFSLFLKAWKIIISAQVFRDAEEENLQNYLKKTFHIYHGTSARKARNISFKHVVILNKKYS